MVRNALDGNTTELQAFLDRVCKEQVLDLVQSNRTPVLENITQSNKSFRGTMPPDRLERKLADIKEWGTGKTFFATEALELGLIDDIQSLDVTIDMLC